jgi:RNA polymerase sigma-70 factor, ECF subfamily
VTSQTVQLLSRLITEDLTRRQREVLIALVLEGVTTEELAKRLDTTPGALYKTLHDARRKLRGKLDMGLCA